MTLECTQESTNTLLTRPNICSSHSPQNRARECSSPMPKKVVINGTAALANCEKSRTNPIHNEPYNPWMSFVRLPFSYVSYSYSHLSQSVATDNKRSPTTLYPAPSESVQHTPARVEFPTANGTCPATDRTSCAAAAQGRPLPDRSRPLIRSADTCMGRESERSHTSKRMRCIGKLAANRNKTKT